ncbi:MAG TPA: dihydroorotate dehydrogenase electron transfer subunit [Vicinamibacterales bacterium]|nr:dihydroorotate dehydrogenase electron transfer subunit [Vicinamibacterales bacterium]
MPIDVNAPVIENRRLSSDYNVLALAAPEIAACAQPGQFVMVKSGLGQDPLLRRPFSVFEVLRDATGQPTGLTLLNKQIGVSTSRLFDATPGERIACLGPLGRPFAPVDPPDRAWMVAGGVGLAPFALLAEALHARGTPMTLFYGARTAAEHFYLDFFERLGVRVILTTDDGSGGERGRVTVPLDRELAALAPDAPVMVYACGPEGMLAAAARVAARAGRPSQVSVERVMGCGMGGCYSCVIPVRGDDGRPHFVRSCIAGPVFAGDQVVWD